MKAENGIHNHEGRVDLAAERALDALLIRHGNPVMNIARRVFSREISECLEQNLGPGTKAHRVGERLVQAVKRKS